MYDCHQKIITVPAADAAGRSLWQKKAPQPEAEEPNLMGYVNKKDTIIQSHVMGAALLN